MYRTQIYLALHKYKAKCAADAKSSPLDAEHHPKSVRQMPNQLADTRTEFLAHALESSAPCRTESYSSREAFPV